MCSMKSVRVVLSTLLGAAAFLLPAQNASAQCSPDIACGVSINPSSGSRVVLGQTVTINFVKAGITASSCFITNGNTWLASPNGAGGQVTSKIMTEFILPVVNTEIQCNGTAGLPGGDTSCESYTTTYIVDADDINRPLSLGSATVLPNKFAADGVQTFPATPKQIHFFAAAEGAGYNDSAFTSFSGNAYGQGQVSLTVVNPGLTVTKICDTNCFSYGAPISFHGSVCNTGDVALANITVTDTPSGGSPILITNFAATTSSGRVYNGTLTNGECIAYSGSYQPSGTGAALCGPFTDTVVASGTATTVFQSPTYSATNSATCEVCTDPCIVVTKNCDTVDIGQGNTVSGTVTNCGDVTLTNISIVDNLYGTLASGLTLEPGAGTTYSQLVTNNTCGNFTNIMTASGTSVCGAQVSDTDTNVCIVTENPCIEVTKNCDTVDPGQTNTVSGVVTNCGNVALINICVIDNLYGTLVCIEELPPGGSQSYSRKVVNPPCSDTTNVVTVTGQSRCGTVVSNSATAVCSVRCLPPDICVTKEVVCELPSGCDTNWSHLAIGAKTADNAQCPSFCYRIRVTNCGQEALTNVTVVDNVLTNLTGCNFPTTLAVGQTVECIIAGVVHCDNVTNTVTASGVGVISGTSVSTNDTAAVRILPIGITCEATVNGRGFTEIPCDGESHLVTNSVRICNTGSLPLSDITILAPNIVALGGDCTNVANLRLALEPGECTNLTLCIDALICPPECGIAFTNHIEITATVDGSKTNVCAFTRNASNQVVAITASTECDAQVGCTQPEACRTTGGGRQDDPLVFPANVRYVTHGGQVGAPVGNQICIVTTNFPLGNPCIHGRWTHVRHEQGGRKGNFHARYYDTLECACLDTNVTATSVTIPNITGGGSQTYTNLVYGPGTTVDGLCNPGHKNPAGPAPRPAPANKIAFTGVGDWTDEKGGRAPRSVLFRVDLEDRSEPGGSHPGGATPPADRYRLRIWVLSEAELMQLRGAGPDNLLLNFRNAISACNGINVQDGASVPNGAAAFGVRAPDVDDGGELERGNHQIHPSIKDCDPFNPTGPGLPPNP